ncbi:MAG: hypothetical protein SGBAC_009728 [Bacillariaceae sp.]
MSKTYGTRRKDTGESMYDGYPLKRLRGLLCYEDDDEARHACKHYSITVKAIQVKSSKASSLVVEFIFWRKSDFKEPVHPEKGYKLPLLPRKMMTTIECKHHGATRLGICRGEASGGNTEPLANTLDTIASSKIDSQWREKEKSLSTHDMRSVSKKHDSRKVIPHPRIADQTADKFKIESDREGREKAAFIKTQQAKITHNAKDENEQCREESFAKERNARVEAAAMACMANEEQIKPKAERCHKQKEIEVRMKLEIETQRKLNAETRKKREIEAQRRLEIETLRRLEIEAKAEQRQQRKREQLRQKRERELAEERRRVGAEMERMKVEAEARRLAAVSQALEAQKLKQAELKKKKEMQDLILLSKKALLLRRWGRRISRNLESIRSSRDDLQNIDPTFLKSTIYLDPWVQKPLDEGRCSMSEKNLPKPGIRSVLEALLRRDVEKRIDLSRLVLEELATVQMVESQRSALHNAPTKTRTYLFKLGILVHSDYENDGMSELVRRWISSTLEIGKIHISGETSFNVRSLAVICQNDHDISDCDVVLCLFPFGGQKCFEVPEEKSVTLHLYHKYGKGGDFAGKASTTLYPEAVSIEYFEIALLTSSTQAIVKSLWMPFSSGRNNEDGIMDRSRLALSALSEEIVCKLKERKEVWRPWPPNDFASSKGRVDDYFSRGQGLPVNWIETLDQEHFEKEVSHLLQVFNSPLREVVTDLLGRDAPLRLKGECASMLSRRQFRGCLEKALRWRECQIKMSSNGCIYFPSGLADLLITGMGSRLSQTLLSESHGRKSWHIPPKFEPHISAIKYFELDIGNQDRNGEGKSISDEIRTASNAEISYTQSELVKRKTPESPLRLQRDASFSKRKKMRTESSNHIMESAAFSKRIERFLHGETLDVQVEAKTLNAILEKQGNSLQENVAIIKARK